MNKYRIYTDSSTKVEVPVTSTIREIASSMGIPYYHRLRIVDTYSDAYVHRRDYRVDRSGFLFSITDVVVGA